MTEIAIHTPAGQQSLQDAKKMLDSLRGLYKDTNKDILIVETDTSELGRSDGFFIKDLAIVGVFEAKVRYKTSRAQLRAWGDRLLVNHDKIEPLVKISRYVQSPAYILTWLVDEPNVRNCFITQITDTKGNLVVDLQVEETYAKATINSARILKKVAKYPVDNSFEFTTFK